MKSFLLPPPDSAGALTPPNMNVDEGTGDCGKDSSTGSSSRVRVAGAGVLFAAGGSILVSGATRAGAGALAAPDMPRDKLLLEADEVAAGMDGGSFVASTVLIGG